VDIDAGVVQGAPAEEGDEDEVVDAESELHHAALCVHYLPDVAGERHHVRRRQVGVH
jgi:hypothetical protein